MGRAMFYQLTRSVPEAVIRQISQRALAQGWRVAVISPDRAMLERLDAALWLGPEDEFLPHSLCGGPHDADQPVLLTDDPTPANGARCLICLDGHEPDPSALDQLERCCILFDGADPGAVEAARNLWRRLTGAGHAAQYWSEASGSWKMEAERAPAG